MDVSLEWEKSFFCFSLIDKNYNGYKIIYMNISCVCYICV